MSWARDPIGSSEEIGCVHGVPLVAFSRGISMFPGEQDTLLGVLPSKFAMRVTNAGPSS